MGSVDIMIGTLLMIYGGSIVVLNNRLINISLIFVMMGTLLIVYHFIKKKLIKRNKNIFFIMLCICLLIFTVTEVFIIGIPKIDKDNADYIIVMATNVEDNSGNLSLTLRGRLDLVVDSIYKDANDSYIVVSGGMVKNSNISEADLMETYLLNQGIPKDKILKESYSNNGEENLKNAEKIIEEKSKDDIHNISVKIVTTDYNALSTKVLAQKAGYNEFILNTSDTNFYLAPALYVYEAFVVLKTAMIKW